MKPFEELQSTSLVWLPEYGVGRYPVDLNKTPYDKAYFDKYKDMSCSEMGRKLNDARLRLVKRHWSGPIIDIGIGCGAFIEEHGNAQGFDINPAGVSWLKERGLWADLYANSYPALCMWDCLEHLPEPEKAVAMADRWIFVSIPIFDNAEHVLRSKHFRKDEHIFYFTHYGLLRWFAEQGFVCMEHNTIESDLGRVGIGSYAFKRVNDASENPKSLP